MRFIWALQVGLAVVSQPPRNGLNPKGIRVIDADVVARGSVEPGQPTLQKIQQLFGTGYYWKMAV